jgi:apolipoprotein D and lipocalin family protein
MPDLLTRRAAALLLLAPLAACAPEAPAPALSFRDRTRPIASTTRGGPADLRGAWVVSASYPHGPGLGRLVGVGSVVGLSTGSGDGVNWNVLDSPGAEAGLFGTELIGPGRYLHRGSRSGPSEIWVLWTDDDFRTAAIGTPDGSFGWIMDRPGEASPDRTEAARRMLEFNGYDLSRLAGA